MKRASLAFLLVSFSLYFLSFLQKASIQAQSCPDLTITYSVKGLSVTFTVEHATDDARSITDGSWTFGDAATGTGVTSSHTYEAYGSYNVSVTASVAETSETCSASRKIRLARRSAKRDTPPRATPTPAPTPTLARTCLSLPSSIRITTTGITQCQQVDAGGVGNSSVIEAGIIDAVDVFSDMGAGAEVCFRAFGSLILLDATTAPRARMALPSYEKDGMTCGWLDRPGTVVLISPVETRPATATATATAVPSKRLEDCMVTLTDILNFRDRPGGNIIIELPAFITLTALMRTAGWFEVDLHGEKGWISADYVNAIGNCG